MADLDWNRFADAVDQRLEELDLSFAGAVWRWPALNKAMLSRACNGQTLSAGNLLLLCRLLELDPFAFVIDGKRRRPRGHEKPTMKTIAERAVTAPAARETREMRG